MPFFNNYLLICFLVPLMTNLAAFEYRSENYNSNDLLKYVSMELADDPGGEKLKSLMGDIEASWSETPPTSLMVLDYLRMLAPQAMHTELKNNLFAISVDLAKNRSELVNPVLRVVEETGADVKDSAFILFSESLKKTKRPSSVASKYPKTISKYNIYPLLWNKTDCDVSNNEFMKLNLLIPPTDKVAEFNADTLMSLLEVRNAPLDCDTASPLLHNVILNQRIYSGLLGERIKIDSEFIDGDVARNIILINLYLVAYGQRQFDSWIESGSGEALAELIYPKIKKQSVGILKFRDLSRYSGSNLSLEIEQFNDPVIPDGIRGRDRGFLFNKYFNGRRLLKGDDNVARKGREKALSIFFGDQVFDGEKQPDHLYVEYNNQTNNRVMKTLSAFPAWSEWESILPKMRSDDTGIVIKQFMHHILKYWQHANFYKTDDVIKLIREEGVRYEPDTAAYCYFVLTGDVDLSDSILSDYLKDSVDGGIRFVRSLMFRKHVFGKAINVSGLSNVISQRACVRYITSLLLGESFDEDGWSVMLQSALKNDIVYFILAIELQGKHDQIAMRELCILLNERPYCDEGTLRLLSLLKAHSTSK